MKVNLVSVFHTRSQIANKLHHTMFQKTTTQ